MILMRVGNQETTINNKVRAVEQIFMLESNRKIKSVYGVISYGKNRVNYDRNVTRRK